MTDGIYPPFKGLSFSENIVTFNVFANNVIMNRYYYSSDVIFINCLKQLTDFWFRRNSKLLAKHGNSYRLETYASKYKLRMEHGQFKLVL